MRALLRKKNVGLQGESRLHLRVMPWDCVLSFVGNDRYHAYMDLGRFDLMVRIGWLKPMWQCRLQPFVRTADIHYKWPLAMFQRFELRTRIIYWDEKDFWIQHIFERKGRIVAIAVSKNVFKGGSGVISTGEALKLWNYAGRSAIREMPQERVRGSVSDGMDWPLPTEEVRDVKGKEQLLEDLLSRRYT